MFALQTLQAHDMTSKKTHRIAFIWCHLCNGTKSDCLHMLIRTVTALMMTADTGNRFSVRFDLFLPCVRSAALAKAAFRASYAHSNGDPAHGHICTGPRRQCDS